MVDMVQGFYVHTLPGVGNWRKAMTRTSVRCSETEDLT